MKTDQEQQPNQDTVQEQQSSNSTPTELVELQQKLADVNDKMLRAMAEAENTRRRAKQDVENAHKYGIEKFARELLHVVDTLEKGLEATNDEGIRLTHKMMLASLEKFNIHQINPYGQDFDPQFHEALTAQPTADMAPNKVLSVVQTGYTLHDRVLRPARVVVAKALDANT